MYKPVDSRLNLPEVEREVLAFWEKNKIFEKSLENRKGAEQYSFYDGPPFATGLPHHGHFVPSVMKDAMPRYWTMKGKYVPRVWGWDCHGLPIENIAEQELKITRKKQIEEMGVEKFNNVCRSKVLEYTQEWQKIIARFGRWADMENAYKTMDLSYMESVWAVFKKLWDRALIYEGYRSMHICPRCETTLSQSEVSEGYRDVKDISVVAKFKKKGTKNIFFLAWTTTPWTLLANVALAVGKNIDYVQVEVENDDQKEEYVLAKARIKDVLKDRQYRIVKEFLGDDLVGQEYEPLFNYDTKKENLENFKNGWSIYTADFVTTEDGTGIVHTAPAFGEDDMKLGQKYNLPFIQHVGLDGRIKKGYGHFSGLVVKDKDEPQSTDVEVIKDLAGRKLIFDKEKFEHSYPHCWRCDTPLLNYATSSWFVDIIKIKDEMLENAKKINWSPKHIKKGRFGNWLLGAREWSISRQRYWASVIPIWKCQCGEMRVIGSVSELEKLSGQSISDIHKDVVDKITFPCSKCNGTMIRIPDVLDTWFDSGSMPYAQIHYPFENEKKFKKSFPADFIAEGVDQTRAWFYYLHAIATATENSIAFKNVIVNGTVLAEDGRKMSKRLKNYPDPVLMIEKYGADVMRYYLLSSPVVQAENLNFKESELLEISRGLFRMLWNSYSFFVLYANIDGWQARDEGDQDLNKAKNILDRWIISELNILIKNVDQGMNEYDLMRSVRYFQKFIDQLSNWYIRRSRKRFWKSENDDDKESAYTTLYYVLVTLSKLLAPFTPFISEEIFKNLTGKESVHLEDFPQFQKLSVDHDLVKQMEQTRKSVEAALSLRARAGIKVRQPLKSFIYTGEKLGIEFLDIIADEVNVEEVKPGKTEALDTNITEELKLRGLAREIIRNIQELRKKSDFNVEDRIIVSFETSSKFLIDVFHQYQEMIKKEVLALEIKFAKTTDFEGENEYKIDNNQIWLGIKRK